ncbi:MAG: tRNA uridine-5-carboxymethylaminomethyl(34) synthesis GTPase MnmE [Muribaculaceae bacterium]|nr:tRNA uridine-5-carboxymethylaminomethyl(34) synthesis GTPase MnmE [Muribaculaceae bacterium]
MEQTLNNILERDTIVAVSTAPGIGGIAVVRLSGHDALQILEKCWRGADLSKIVSHTAHLGKIIDRNGDAFDEVVITYFKGPKSFTGEDVVEISCHGSRWIQREIVNLLIGHGARPASPGEYTQRAFINGRLDLAQAEGVIDLISSSSRAAHRLAMQQTSGRFSGYLGTLREQLIDLASLLELELDFSEEDVEFADREKLRNITADTLATLRKLAKSYATGKVLKEGIPVVIAGAPNAGKSTLLNALLDEDKAIVSDIPGTTRDVIEDTAEIDGVLFRFADTAGLREASDAIEKIGIERAEERLRKARIVLWLVDVSDPQFKNEIDRIKVRIAALLDAKHILLLNKTDLATGSDTCSQSAVMGSDTCSQVSELDCVGTFACKRNQNEGKINEDFASVISISAAKGEGIEKLKETMVKEGYGDYNPENDIMLTNGRHYAAILNGIAALQRVAAALTPSADPTELSQADSDLSSGKINMYQDDYIGLSADLIAQDVREALHHLSLLTGTISTPDLLTTIFSRFCIGK